MVASNNANVNPNDAAEPDELAEIFSIMEANEPPPAPQPSAPARRFTPLTFDELIALPPKRWIVALLLGIGDLLMIYGAPGSGKTFVIIDLIFKMCLGQAFAKRFEVDRPLNIAYAAGEGISGLPARFSAAAKHYGVTSMPNFTFYATTPSLYYEKNDRSDLDSIEKFIIEWKERVDTGEAQPLDVLVIDTMHSATAGADENSARDMGVVLDLCKKATRLLGCAVILVHHSNKSGTGERGSSALRGAMDCMIECEQVAGKFAISCTKLKDGASWQPQSFDLIAINESVYVEWGNPDDSIDNNESPSASLLALMNEHVDTKFTAKQLAEPLSMGQSAVLNILKRLHDRGEINRELYQVERPPSNRNPWVYSVKPHPKTASTGVNDEVIHDQNDEFIHVVNDA